MLLLALPYWASGQARLQPVIDRIEATMLQAEQVDGFSGVVLVGRGEEVLYENSFGWAGPQMDRKNSLDRKFMIASVSKGFAAVSILQLESRGLLSTDDLIGDYLPGYPSWAGKNITIHQLLTHTSGIPDYINDRPIWFKLQQMGGWTPTKDELIASFQNRPLNFLPGTRFKYSNSGYVLLAKIVENVSGQEYGTYLYEHILDPLGMFNTGAGDFDMVGNRAMAFNQIGGKLRPIANFKNEWIYGMGELYSTAGDLNRWLQSFGDTVVLSEAAKAKMMATETHNYGYGWHVQDFYGHPLISHGGYLPGWNSYVYYFPQDTLSVIVVSNSEKANPMEMCSHISRILFLNKIGTPPSDASAQYAGRYEIVGNRESLPDTPFESEIVTLHPSEGGLQLRTPRGKTLRLTRLQADQWTDPQAQLKMQFKADGLLQVTKNGQEWQWRKLSGDFKPAAQLKR